MNVALISLIVLTVAMPTFLSVILFRYGKLLYSGPALVRAYGIVKDKQGMYPVTLIIPGMTAIKFAISSERICRVRLSDETVMVSVTRRLFSEAAVISQVLWPQEAQQAARDGRYDKIKPDRPVDTRVSFVPSVLYFALSAVSAALYVGDNFVASQMRADELLMHAFWYGNAACVALCGYWSARSVLLSRASCRRVQAAGC